MKAAYGLDKPWYQAYFVWLGNVARGDLGRSISRKAPVTQLIGERVGPTLALSAGSLLLTWLLSIPLGLYAAARSGRGRRAGREPRCSTCSIRCPPSWRPWPCR